MNFLLSSPSLDHVDSDGEAESFQKIHCQKFECAQGQPSGGEKFENVHACNICHLHYQIYVIYIACISSEFGKTAIWASESDFWRFWDPKIHWGPALRAMFRILAEPRVVVIVALAHEW